MQKDSGHPDAGPLSPEDVRLALERSGYPLEVELLSELAAKRVPAALGQRHEIAKGEYKEIDLSALIRMRPAVRREDGATISVFHRLLVQVKRPPGNAQLVGVMGRQPTSEGRRFERLVLAGSICAADELDDAGSEVLAQLSGAEEPFDEIPICAHWAVVKRRKQADGKTYEPWATGDDTFYEDLSTLVRAREFDVHAALASRHSMAPNLVRLRPVTVALVVDQPQIFVYDPMKRELQPTPQMTLAQDFDTAYGPVRAYVDCVTRSEFAAFIDKCREVAARLSRVAGEQSDAVFAISEALRRTAELELLTS